MDKGQFLYDCKVIRRAYRDIWKDPIFGLTIFILTCLFLTSLFLILVCEPADRWHETSFVLDRMEIRSTGRGGHVLDLYTSDGRIFVINRNDDVIHGQLQSGNRYSGVYSADFFHNILQELHDEGQEYLNLESGQREASISFAILYGTLFISGTLLLVLNGLFIMQRIKLERNRMKRFTASKKKHK